ncbi:MAG TPA: GNAT family N-acetyltransferase [Nitrospiraceae bacterium]|nr:GNAT family N-acetyltransferase [Nitrospiraceae bacterium]
MTVMLRMGSPEDAKACSAICYEAFKTIADQHNFPREFPHPEMWDGLIPMLLSRRDIYSVVAEKNGAIVGANFLWEASLVAGVGPIGVEPSAQNSAIGRRLMEHVLERARQRRFPSVRLVQVAYHNRSLSLYTKLGFDVREPLVSLHGPPLGITIPGHVVRSATPEDLEAGNRLCWAVHGHDRGPEFQEAIEKGTVTVVEHNGRLTGYATLIGYFGHAVGESNEALKALIGAATVFHGPGFLLPTRNGELLRWCLENGLRIVQPMTLMSRGLYNEPAGPFLPSILY